ncbi:MAG: haloacid dehalogenase-like hydrolase [Myxococcota bacterium]|nr:haloacid dehalogenase-like hydrolase [Myxococcota bacterium]
MTEEHIQEEGLAQGAWLPEVHEAIINLVNAHGIHSESYNPEKPPLAVLDCDGTLICNDIGEAMLRFMVTRRRLNTDRGFWNAMVPEKLGRDALSAAYKAVAGRSDNDVFDTAAYRRYRAGMLNVYETLRASSGYEDAYLFAARLLRGLHERTVADLVEEVLDYELDRQLGTDDIPPGPPFSGLSVPTGIRMYNEMFELLQLLDTYGFSVWIVSSSNAYIVKALARRSGFPEEQVLGIELQTQSGRYTDRPVEPTPIGEGKLELFLDTVGRSPVLVIGDSMNDFELLENCEGVSIVIDQGDKEIIDQASEHGWYVQPPLSL